MLLNSKELHSGEGVVVQKGTRSGLRVCRKIPSDALNESPLAESWIKLHQHSGSPQATDKKSLITIKK